MKRTLTLFLVLVVGLFLGIAACKKHEQPAAPSGSRSPAAQSQASPQQSGTDVGGTMPEYSAMWLDGSKFDLAARRKNVVLLNLWATWCGPCRFEIPELQKMHAHYGPKGFEVIGVSVDEGGVETVKQFVTENEMTYPIVVDPEGKLANLFQTSVLPTTALIDRNGRVVWKHYGLIQADDPELKRAIEKAL